MQEYENEVITYVRDFLTRNQYGSTIERIVKKYADCVRADHPNMPDSCYPHMFRRSRATGMYRDDDYLEMISAILGHANSETPKYMQFHQWNR